MRRLLILSLLALSMTAQADDEMFGNWLLTSVEDAEAYATFMSLQQDSSNTIKDEYATKDVAPQISFRCRPGNADITARIDWRRFISSFSTEAGFKVDDGKRSWRKWKVSSSEQVTISPGTDDTQALLAQLEGGANLEVEISPYSSSPVTVHYDLADLDAGIKALQAACMP